jgi:hypothetical protein
MPSTELDLLFLGSGHFEIDGRINQGVTTPSLASNLWQ